MKKGKRTQMRAAPLQITAKGILGILSLVCLGASLFMFYHINLVLSDGDWFLSGLMSAVTALVPPAMTSFLFPSTPSGMLLQRIQWKFPGYTAVMIVWAFTVYYSGSLLWSWWAGMPTTVEAGLVPYQTVMSIIGFIIIPGLIWVPITDDELIDVVRQNHLIERYKIQEQADLALLRGLTLRARYLALRGLSNLTAGQQQEFHAIITGLVNGIDESLKAIGQSVRTVAGDIADFDGMSDNENIQVYLDGVSQMLLSDTDEDDMLDLSQEEVREEPVHVQRETLRHRRVGR
jgi:hypothetical protein